MKILAADDDDLALEILVSALRGAGYTDVISVTSGAEALKVIEESSVPFDAFLLDIKMPGIDGIELCSMVRAMPLYAIAPIVMITAMKERHYIDRAFAAGAMDYINKPFDPVELGVRIGIADRLARQSHQVEEAATEVALLKSRTGVGAKFAADEPVTIHGVPRVISMTAMENYLLQLTYWMALKSKSVAFSISGFSTVHAQCDPAEMYDILSDAAYAIAEGFKHTNHLVTYVGNGQFVAVLNGSGSAIDREILASIQFEIDQTPPILASGRLCPITFEMGEIYSPGLWSAPNRLSFLHSPQLMDRRSAVTENRHSAAA